MEERIKELERLIPYYAENYYKGNTLIPDSEFDKLTEELERLKPESEILSKVGWGSVEDSKGKIKLEHYYTEVGSLKKTRVYEEIPEIFKKEEVCISPKLDGLTMVCYYKNGKLDKAITRGDGLIGIDKTSKMVKILSNKNISIPSNFTGAIRGELLIPQKSWEIIKTNNSEANNSRNYAAGLINRDDDSEDLKYIDFVTYKVLGDTERRFNSKTEVVSFLKDCGFDTIYSIKKKIDKNWQEYAEQLYESDYPYQLDGLVMSLENITYNDRDGIEYKEFAYKFQSETADVKVLRIEWKMTKGNKLFPTVWFEPTYLGEATVQKATGFNAKFILDNKIQVGSLIKICRANEVIPYIMEVVHE